MSSLQTSSLVFTSSPSVSKRSMMAKASIDVSNRQITNPRSAAAAQTTQKKKLATIEQPSVVFNKTTPELSTAKLYAILEVVCDRAEMHENIGHQRDNWNALLLGSVNSMTLSAAVISAISSATQAHHHLSTLLTLNLSSFVLLSAAAGISAVMAKIQPSQLAEEQRNASRLFRQLQFRLETVLAIRSPTETDVSEAMEEILALDRAFPLPLLGGAMIEKFPERFEPAVWWPSKKETDHRGVGDSDDECLEIARVLRSKDGVEYERLGGLVLRINKALAILGPALGVLAAASAPFVGFGEWAAVAAVGGGAVACAVNSVQHGVQIGMVVEMYRNCAGALRLMEETIEREEREDGGELFLMKMALGLGRSLPQMAEIAAKSVKARENGTVIDEFASKLF